MIGAGFFYLLYHLVKNMDVICSNLNTFGDVLHKVSETLLKIDLRVEELEKEIRELKRGKSI